MISVIIPVKNGAQTLGKCLRTIRNQTITSIEIIVLDSMSTDKSKEIALSYNAEVIDVPAGTFNHGLTRNEGVKYCKGDLIFFTVQDAFIAENNMLERMSAHFTDKSVMAVVGHQGIPHELDKNPSVWFKRMTKPTPETRYFPTNTFVQLPKNKQVDLSRWDNVVAMYRKEALIDLPFQKTNFCEDCLWANMALNKGYKIISDSSLLVYHYHHLTFNYFFKTTFIVNYYFLQFFDYSPQYPRVIFPFLSRINTLRKNKQVTLSQKIYWIGHNTTSLFGAWLSVFVFKFFLFFFGKNGLDNLYKIVCKTVPQGMQKNI